MDHSSDLRMVRPINIPTISDMNLLLDSEEWDMVGSFLLAHC